MLEKGDPKGSTPQKKYVRGVEVGAALARVLFERSEILFLPERSQRNIGADAGKKVCACVCSLKLGFRVHDLIFDCRAHFFFFENTAAAADCSREHRRNGGDTTKQTTHTRTADGVRITGDTHAQQAIASGLDAAVDSRW